MIDSSDIRWSRSKVDCISTFLHLPEYWHTSLLTAWTWIALRSNSDWLRDTEWMPRAKGMVH